MELQARTTAEKDKNLTNKSTERLERFFQVLQEEMGLAGAQCLLSLY